MPSPVWLDDDPASDFDDILDDFVLDGTDDYFDQQPATKRKRPASDIDGQPGTDPDARYTKREAKAQRKRQQVSGAAKAPESSTIAPIVVWRTQGHSPLSYPVIDGGNEGGVAILKDWKERSKNSNHGGSNEIKSRPSSKTFAVIVERRQSDKGYLPSAISSTKFPPAKKKEAKLGVNGNSTTASSRATNTSKRESTPTAVLRPVLAQKGNPTVLAGKKREVSELDDEEDELQADSGHFNQSKKRVVREASSILKGSTQGTAGAAKGRKRKLSESEPAASTKSAKRITTRPKVAEIPDTRNSRIGKDGPTTRPSTRRKR